MSKPKEDELDSIEEVEKSFRALQDVLYPIIQKQRLIASDRKFQENPSEQEFDLLEEAQKRFNDAKENMQRIAAEIRSGVRK